MGLPGADQTNMQVMPLQCQVRAQWWEELRDFVATAQSCVYELKCRCTIALAVPVHPASHRSSQWDRVSLFAQTGVKSVLPRPCFSVSPILVSPILLLTDIPLNATVICRTRGECSEMFLEASSKGQVNGYLCANTDSDPRRAARVVESVAIICSHSAGWHSTEMT